MAAAGSSEESEEARDSASPPSSDDALRARLPRGANSLPQDLIAEIQRQRLLEAVTLEVGENGYAATAVASIIERAGVSRKTFYELFSDKDQCYTSALEGALEEHMHFLGSTESADGDARSRLRTALQNHLIRLNADLVRARAFFVESVSAAALSREAAVMWLSFSTRLGDLIGRCMGSEALKPVRHDPSVMIMLVGGLNTLVATTLAAEADADLTQLAPAALLVVGRAMGLPDPVVPDEPIEPTRQRDRRGADRQ